MEKTLSPRHTEPQPHFARPAAVYDAAPRNLGLRWFVHDTLSCQLRFNQRDVDGTYSEPFDVTGYNFSAMVTENNTDTVVLLLTVNSIAPKEGRIEVRAESWETNLVPGSYRWMLSVDSQLTGNQETWVAGSFEVIR